MACKDPPAREETGAFQQGGEAGPEVMVKLRGVKRAGQPQASEQVGLSLWTKGLRVHS